MDRIPAATDGTIRRVWRRPEVESQTARRLALKELIVDANRERSRKALRAVALIPDWRPVKLAIVKAIFVGYAKSKAEVWQFCCCRRRAKATWQMRKIPPDGKFPRHL